MNVILLKRGLAILTLSALATAMAGCSSDEAPVGPGGSLSDPAFLEVQPQINTFLDSIFVAFSAGLSSYNEVPISGGQIKTFYGPGIPGGVNQSSYEYTAEGWHHITVSVTSDVAVLGVNDSIQFKSGQTVQQAATGADALDYRHHWAVTQKDQTSDYTNISGDVGFVFSGLNSQNTSINGSYGFAVDRRTIDASSVITDNSFEFSSSTSNVSVAQPSGGAWGTGCPSSGAVSFSIAQVRIVTTGSVIDTTTITWTGTVSFFSGVATVSLSDGTTSWGYSNSVCNPAL